MPRKIDTDADAEVLHCNMNAFIQEPMLISVDQLLENCYATGLQGAKNGKQMFSVLPDITRDLFESWENEDKCTYKASLEKRNNRSMHLTRDAIRHLNLLKYFFRRGTDISNPSRKTQTKCELQPGERSKIWNIVFAGRLEISTTKQQLFN